MLHANVFSEVSGFIYPKIQENSFVTHKYGFSPIHINLCISVCKGMSLLCIFDYHSHQTDRKWPQHFRKYLFSPFEMILHRQQNGLRTCLQ